VAIGYGKSIVLWKVRRSLRVRPAFFGAAELGINAHP
jgi:hypothetical protein